MPIKRTEPIGGGLYNRNFRYRPASQSDIRKTFERIKRERLKAEKVEADGQRLLNLGTDAGTVVALPLRAGRTTP